MNSRIRQYVLNVLISIDQFANTLAGGDPDETISSRLGKRVGTCSVCAGICWVLDKINRNHCKSSIEADEGARAVIK